MGYSNRFTVFDKNGHVNHQLKLPIKSSSPAHSSMAPSLETELFPNIVDDDHPSTEFSELSDDSPPSFASSLPVEIEQSFLYKFQSSVNGLVQNITNRSLDLAGPKNLEVRTDQKVSNFFFLFLVNRSNLVISLPYAIGLACRLASFQGYFSGSWSYWFISL